MMHHGRTSYEFRCILSALGREWITAYDIARATGLTSAKVAQTIKKYGSEPVERRLLNFGNGKRYIYRREEGR